MSKFSYITARVNAVSFLAFSTRGLAPNLRSNSTIFKWPLIDAFIRLEVSEKSLQSIEKTGASLVELK